MKKIIYRLAAIITFIIFISCGNDGASKSSTPGDVVKAMIESIMNENLDGFIAISLNAKGENITEKDLKATKELMSFVKNDIEKKGGLKEVAILEENISEDGLKATVILQLIYNNGKKALEGNTKLIKVDGVWKIKSL